MRAIPEAMTDEKKGVSKELDVRDWFGVQWKRQFRTQWTHPGQYDVRQGRRDLIGDRDVHKMR